jgi:hypothetical protein
MKAWWVRVGFWLADGGYQKEHWDDVVEATSMEGALARGVREARKAMVPPRKKVVEIRARVEPAERRPKEVK